MVDLKGRDSYGKLFPQHRYRNLAEQIFKRVHGSEIASKAVIAQGRIGVNQFFCAGRALGRSGCQGQRDQQRGRRGRRLGRRERQRTTANAERDTGKRKRHWTLSALEGKRNLPTSSGGKAVARETAPPSSIVMAMHRTVTGSGSAELQNQAIQLATLKELRRLSTRTRRGGSDSDSVDEDAGHQSVIATVFHEYELLARQRLSDPRPMVRDFNLETIKLLTKFIVPRPGCGANSADQGAAEGAGDGARGLARRVEQKERSQPTHERR